jgi:hypothetical protein
MGSGVSLDRIRLRNQAPKPPGEPCSLLLSKYARVGISTAVLKGVCENAETSRQCMSNFQHVELLDIESLYIPHAPRPRQEQSVESLFLPEELQETGSQRWQTVRDVLWSFGPDVLHLFDRAWASRNLRQCPDFSTWTSCLKRMRANGMNPAQ